MRKIFIPLFMALVLLVTACGPTAPTQAVVEPTQALEAAVEPTQAPTNTTEPTNSPEPTAIPENSTGGTGVFFSSGVTLADLADKLPLYDVLLDQELRLMAEGIALGGREVFVDGEFYTIFAAEELPEGLTDMGEAVRAMWYLIVPGLYLEADLLAMDGQSLPTMKKDQVINITVKDGEVYLNDVAIIIQRDVLAQNGVIHVIDEFILPPTD